jgi:hypothetical protein
MNLPVTVFLLYQNIFLSTLFSNIRNVCIGNVRDQVSHPYVLKLHLLSSSVCIYRRCHTAITTLCTEMCRAFTEFHLPLTSSWMDFDLFHSFPSVLTLALTHSGRIHELSCYTLSLITVRKLRIYPISEVRTCGPLVALATDFPHSVRDLYEGWNFNSGNYLFTTDTK